ncbi:CBS domain-containing protein [Singulisphaera sp. Ch08]|uniref:CBS domain-containing protein n=1 Tax=Singulisphaera sp. Ch08 TaxID=3120278 RepID=A0AAU7CA82_9BACT
MKALEIMVQPVVTIRRDTSLEEAARIMLNNRFGCLPVVDDSGRLCGIVTESDFAAKERGIPFSTLFLPQVLNEWIPLQGIERIYQAARTTPVSTIMGTDPASVSEETSVEEVVKQMLYRDINHVPVIRDGIPVGIISRHDLLRIMIADAESG